MGRAIPTLRLVFAVVLATAPAGCMGVLEDRFIFFPSRDLIGSPADTGLFYTDVQLTTADGERLHGWWVPADAERGVLLFFHGNAGNVSDRLESIAIFHGLGLSVFIVDYRGYGRSTGIPSEAGTYADGDAAWRYLVEDRGVAADRIVVFGRSLGGGVGCHVAAKHAPRALIVESAFTSIRDMASIAMPLLPLGPFLATRYDNLATIERVGCPVLVVHSRDDEIIPFAHGRRLYAAAPEPKEFLELREGHNEGFLLSGAVYTAGLDGFLTRHLGARTAGAAPASG